MTQATTARTADSSARTVRAAATRDPAIANRIFGYERLAPDLASPPAIRVEGAEPIGSGPNARAWQLEILATPGTHLQTFVSAERGTRTVVWGVPAHPELARADVAAWCADVVARGQFDRFRDLLGTFVVIVDEPRQHRLTFVSDALGIRPLFIGRRDGRLVFGSSVWPMQEAGLTTGELDYAALGSWIAYGYACTGGSLFADLKRLPPGGALVIEDGRTVEVSYTSVEPTDRAPATGQAAEELHEIVWSAARALLKEQPPLSLPLSGGFDSRYLLALSLELKAPLERIVNVNFTAEEAEVSHRVAGLLGVPIEDFPVATSVWDLYQDVHHFMADGLPISKFVTYKVAERYPGMPMVNGFLGGIIVRGFDDVFDGRHESEWDDDPVTVIQRNFLLCDLDLFQPAISRRIRERSREPLEVLARRGSPAGKIMDWTNMYNRQRYLASNNYLQHLGLAEAVLPFYSWRLIRYKMEHPYRVFHDAVYHTIFSRYYPALENIPHSDELRRARLRQTPRGLAAQIRQWRSQRPRVARCTARWARQLLPILTHDQSLGLVARERCIPLAVLGLSTLPSRMSERVAPVVESALLTLRRLHVLEMRVKQAHLELDWNRL